MGEFTCMCNGKAIRATTLITFDRKRSEVKTSHPAREGVESYVAARSVGRRYKLQICRQKLMPKSIQATPACGLMSGNIVCQLVRW